MNNSKATGVVLLTMLFTFGLFFNPDSNIDENLLNRKLAENFKDDPLVSEYNEFKNSVEESVLLNNETKVDQEDKKKLNKMKSSKNNDGQEKKKPVTLKPVNQPKEKSINEQVMVPIKEEPTHIAGPLLLPEIKEWRPNTTYLLCNNVQQLSPPVNISDLQDPNSPMVLSLFIPPEPDDYSVDKSMLEVTCSVIDMKVSNIQYY